MVLGGLAGLAAPAQAAGVISFNCTGPFGPMTYETSSRPTVTRTGGSVAIDWALDNMDGIVPVPASADMEVSSTLLVNGASVKASGAETVEIQASQPFALPNVKASVATSATTVDLKVSDLTITVANFDGMVFPCTLPAPAELGSYEVGAPPAPAPKAAKTTSKTKVAFKKKAKKATVTTTVKAGKKNAKGKVRITVKRGKKVVVNKTVTLKKGKAKLVVKKGKLKAKGKYVVTARYLGNKNFAASKAKNASFKVKK